MNISRQQYADLFGPTTGDRIRLGDTGLFIEIEKDYASYGDEVMFGGGKVIRDGQAQSSTAARRDPNVPDLVITNVIILDHWGIVKADVGVRDGRICGIGKAGNPDTQNDVSPGMTIGASTEIISGKGMILTAGGIDTHIHHVAPQQIWTALESGLTTMIGGGTGPAAGSTATSITPGKWYIHRMLESLSGLPMNFGLLGKGNCSSPEPLVEQIRAGAVGLKIHEDWGSTPPTIRRALEVADQYDIQVALHSDSLNESTFVDGCIDAFEGRTIHSFHTEGAGGGHAPDIIRISGLPNVLPSSTNSTMPFTVNTIVEHLDMLLVAHHLDSDIPEDVAFAESRIRPETVSAEDVLQDLGIISMMSSDSQAMGRVGEVISRTWQSADKMKKQRGSLKGDGRADNFRAKRYVAKYTINPAITHGIAHEVGSVEVGKLADLVLWYPKFFGVKPNMVIKGGLIVAADMGDINAAITTPQPVYMRPMYAAFGRGMSATCLHFVSQLSLQEGNLPEVDRPYCAVKNTRDIGKKDMIHNSEAPEIYVNPETFEVYVNGELMTSDPAEELPLAQKYFLF